ncbi:hypothetical protein ACUXAV_005556 [Cupriavidus metallidurans]|jgi:hypothetical protein|nr:hypothetical protein C3Z06_12240 [Cupriavidus metallidurans]KWW32912.1 hypothetical protein AU374_05670 [Cupriavidus metallidurans]
MLNLNTRTMFESLMYKDRHLKFDVVERTYGDWCWTYTIDGRTTFSSHGNSYPTRELAAIDAMDEALLRIDKNPV